MFAAVVIAGLVAAIGAGGPPAPAAQPQSGTRVCRANPATSPASRPAGSASGTIADAGWIAGRWIASSGSTTVEEMWTSGADGVMFGIGRTLRDGRLVSFEYVCIVERGGTLVYTAMPGARTPATDFTATAIGPQGVTFENAAHDFPKLVRYARLADGRLETTVSGGGADKGETIVLRRQEAGAIK